MKIANPLYDAVFKFLMQDKASASMLISTLLEVEVLDLDFHTREVSVTIPRTLLPLNPAGLTVMRLDFKATIRLKDGSNKVVIIELQKAKVFENIKRFRRYLGMQYVDDGNYTKLDDGQEVAHPLVSIYILGYNLAGFETKPVVKIIRKIIDNHTGEAINYSHDFIESLSHDSVIAQIPAAKGKRRNRVERLLNLFALKESMVHELSSEFKTDEFRAIIDRLYLACQDAEVQEALLAEKEYMDDYIQKMERLAQAETLIERERLQKEKAQAEKKKAEETLLASIKLMLQSGIPREAIAKALGIKPKDLDRLI